MGYFVSGLTGIRRLVAEDGVYSSLASAGNELKLQGTGSGLDDLEEEFMDGRLVRRFVVTRPRLKERFQDSIRFRPSRGSQR